VDVTVRLLQRRELRAASRLLARAFAHDPFIGYFFADQRRRRSALPPFFRAVLHQLADSHTIFACEVENRLDGVAAWLPPEPAEAAGRSAWLARVASMELRILFPRATAKVLAGFEELGQRHPATPHWYLAFVGIEPARQGRGLGSSLLAPVLQQADEAGVDCYLETPFPETRAFYGRLGFGDTEELRPVPGAPPIWTMTRGPRSAPAASSGWISRTLDHHGVQFAGRVDDDRGALASPRRPGHPGAPGRSGHRGSGFGPVAVTSRCGTQSSTCLKPSKRPSSSSTTSKKERR